MNAYEHVQEQFPEAFWSIFLRFHLKMVFPAWLSQSQGATEKMQTPRLVLAQDIYQIAISSFYFI